MQIRILFLLLAAGLLNACAEKDDDIQKSWDEVMAIHDEVMPKISDINATVKSFKNIRENDTENFTTYREQILINLQNLESAEEGMFNWMNELKGLSDLSQSMSKEEVLAYLDDEKVKVSKVKDAILSSLADSKALLDKIKN